VDAEDVGQRCSCRVGNRLEVGSDWFHRLVQKAGGWQRRQSHVSRLTPQSGAGWRVRVCLKTRRSLVAGVERSVLRVEMK